MKQYLVPFLVGVALVACMLVTYQIGRGTGYDKGFAEGIVAIPPRTDTMWREKPVYIDRPVEVVKWKEREKLVYVPKDSLIYVHDTVPALPREFKQYSGEEYEAVVSGVEPALESLKIFKKEMVVTNTITVERPIPYKWTLSAFGDVGYPLGVRGGLSFDRQVAGPLRWYLQGGYEYTLVRKGPFVEAGARLQILKK